MKKRRRYSLFFFFCTCWFEVVSLMNTRSHPHILQEKKKKVYERETINKKKKKIFVRNEESSCEETSLKFPFLSVFLLHRSESFDYWKVRHRFRSKRKCFSRASRESEQSPNTSSLWMGEKGEERRKRKGERRKEYAQRKKKKNKWERV